MGKTKALCSLRVVASPAGKFSVKTRNMHQLILTLSLIIAPFSNDAASMVLRPANFGSPPGGNIVANVWQDFEISAITQAQLEAHDHSSLTWASPVNTGGTFSISSSGEQATLSTVGGSADTGTSGIAVDMTKTASDYMNCAGMGTLTTISFGMWVKTPSASLAGNREIIRVHTGGSIIIAINYNTRDFVLNNGTVIGSAVNTLSLSTWYWVTGLAVKNGTCKLRIYDSAGALVGSEKTTTGANTNIDALWVGSASVAPTAGTGTMYWDDLVIDSSTAVFPLGP